MAGQYDSAAFYNLDAIRLFDAMGDPVRAASVMCSHGYQIKRRNLDEAFRFYRKGIQVLERETAEAKLLAGYDNFGVLFEMRGDLDSAIFYYQESLKKKEKVNDSIGIPYSLNNIAVVQLMKNQPTQAKANFDRAFEIRKRRNDAFGVLENKSFYGDFYRQEANWNLAISWYKQSNADCDRLRYPAQKKYNLEQMSYCYEALGDTSMALLTFKEVSGLGQELINQENSKTVIEMEKRFELAEKEKANAELKERSARKTLYVWIITSLLLVVAIGAALYHQVLNRKQKAKRDSAIIQEREAGLRAVFDATEEERKRIAKDLHDGIGQQLSGLKLGWSALNGRMSSLMLEEVLTLHKLTRILDESAADVRNISHQMMPKAFQTNGLLPALNDMLNKSLGLT